MPGQSALEAALAYSSRGWFVLPVNAYTKVALTEWATDRPSTDEAVIRAWWERWPNAGVAIHAGLSNLAIIDVDEKDDGTIGEESLTNWLGGHLDQLAAFRDSAGAITRTPSGCEHLWFSADALFEGAGRKIGWLPAVDLLVDKGYFLAPGSPGYDWVEPPVDGPLPQLPARLLADLASRVKAGSDDAPHKKEIWAEGTRDVALFKELSRLRGQAKFGEAELRHMALFLNRTRCVPPLPDDEVEAKVQQAMKYVAGEAPDVRVLTDHLLAGMRDDNGAEIDPWALLSWSEIKDLPPPTWLIEEALPETGVAYIGGKSGGGKTFVVLDLLLRVTNGLDWFGRRVARSGSCVYVAMEDFQGVPERMRAWSQHHGGTSLDGLFVLREPPLDLSDGERLSRLVESVERLDERPVAIAIDTQALATPGVEENSNTDMGEVMVLAKALSRRLGALVLLVHHTGHGDEGRIRGASAMHAAADAVIVVENGRLRPSKLKSASLWPAERFAIVPVAGTRSATVQPFDFADLQAAVEDQLERDGGALIQYLRDVGGRASWTSLLRAPGFPGRPETLEPVIEHLERSGRVQVEHGMNRGGPTRHFVLVAAEDEVTISGE